MGIRNTECPAIGIDLGTSYSRVGIWQNGHVEIIPNDQGRRMTPSWVAFTDTQRLIGEAAVNQGRTNSPNAIFDAKRLIGRRFNDDVVQKDLKYWPFTVIDGPHFGRDDKPLIEVTYMGKAKRFSAEEISAMVLMKMKDIAVAYLGKSVTNAVVTVPAYFNGSQRQATKDAGAIAGLNVLHIINEPTAAAIAYDFEKNTYGSHKNTSDNEISSKKVLVFDLGGGTFDVSLVSIEKDKLKVKSVNGDAHLGGCDFDNRMVGHFVEEFKMKYNKDMSQNRKAIAKLRLACEKAKRVISLIPETGIELDYLYDGIDFSSTISRECFENINADLFQKCIDLVKQCLEDARIEKSDVDEIVLVGGSTRIPKVQQLLQELFDGKEPFKSINPDEAVAYGAALNAAILCGLKNPKIMVPIDVTPLSLGVADSYSNMFIVIPRNTTIIPQKHKYLDGSSIERRPSLLHRFYRKSRKFITRFIPKCVTQGNDDSKTTVLEIYVYEGERSKSHDNHFLGIFEISGISPSDNDPSKFINVWFEIDINGILNVSAQDTRSGNKSQITVTNRNRLNVTAIDKMRNEAEEYMAQDKKYEQMVEAKNTLEDYANDMWEKVTNYGEDNAAKVATQTTLDWIDLNSDKVLDADKYEKKLKELESICTASLSVMR
ncbi:hypothetical protein RND81_03G052900 [Saponaria officinalis]|uniref:Uncharacterized protein n=1 Tax=Saponaria officinalis TaxID=3572 RepID=A0AAW1LYT2_SAPOF